MDITLDGIVTCVKPLQKRNAPSPMDVTLDRIEIRAEHSV
jgi:hypothetical protein